MKNLKELNIQELSIEEQRNIDGGVIPFAVAIWLIGATAAAGGTAYGAAYAIGEYKANRDKGR